MNKKLLFFLTGQNGCVAAPSAGMNFLRKEKKMMKDKTFFLTSFYLVDKATNQNFTVAPSAKINFLQKEKKMTTKKAKKSEKRTCCVDI